MNIVFAGTPDFSVTCLQALIKAGHPISAVLTQPDRRAGRGKKISMSPVKRCALQHNLPVIQPERLTNFDFSALERPDLMVVVAYGLILPQAVLDWPKLGCINVHASLLPRWRGAAPIQRAIEAGDTESGVCIMRMDAGLDTGDIFNCAALRLESDETGGSLHDKLAELGAEALLKTVDELATGDATRTPQPADGVTYAEKLRKDEARIHWNEPAEIIERQIRAFNPWPATWTTFRGKPLKLFLATIVKASGSEKPGEVIAADRNRLTVAAGEDALQLLEVQPAGKKRMSGVEFINGYQIKPGERLGASV